MSKNDMISASELERYGYCPLSWWMAIDGDTQNDELVAGSDDHRRISGSLLSVKTKEQGGWELRFSYIVSVAMVGNLLALFTIGILDTEEGVQAGWLFAISLVWLAIGLLLLHRAYLHGRWYRYTFQEMAIVAISILMMMVALNTIAFIQMGAVDGTLYLLLAIFWFIITVVILALHHLLTGDLLGLRTRSSLEGEVVYVGEGPSELLVSERHGLTGRPDILLRRDNDLVPVEIKTGRVPRGPLFSHILQLGAYCVIVGELEGQRLEKGVLRYGWKEFEIEFDESLEELVVLKLKEMRRLRESGEAHRNHNRPGKCRGCSRRAVCPESLA